jgi:hypothetical protein
VVKNVKEPQKGEKTVQNVVKENNKLFVVKNNSKIHK